MKKVLAVVLYVCILALLSVCSFAVYGDVGVTAGMDSSKLIALNDDNVINSEPLRNEDRLIAKNVYDGDYVNNFFHALYGADYVGKTGYIGVNAGTKYFLDAVVIVPRQDVQMTWSLWNARIEGSDDGENWTTIHTITTEDLGMEKQEGADCATISGEQNMSAIAIKDLSDVESPVAYSYFRIARECEPCEFNEGNFYVLNLNELEFYFADIELPVDLVVEAPIVEEPVAEKPVIEAPQTSETILSVVIAVVTSAIALGYTTSKNKK